MAERVYLDWNATAPLRSEARAAMAAAMDVAGNPSSVHAEGRAARGLVERARAQVAGLAGCDPDQIVFTSGASEAASAAVAARTGGLWLSAVEHDALAQFGAQAGAIAVDGRGVADLDGAFAQGLEPGDLVVLQSANSETGVCQDVAAAARRIRDLQPRALLLGDMVQSLGKEAFALSWLDLDFALFSAHKLGGPKGVGALVDLKADAHLSASPLIRGGGQEQGRRSGTENVIGIAGFGAAAEAARRDLDAGVWEALRARRDAFEARILDAVPEAIIVGRGAGRLPNTSAIAVPGWKGETQVMQMDLAGFAISAGSACSSGKLRQSRVLKAMGFDDTTAASAIRVSIGPTTATDDLMRFAEVWSAHYMKFKSRAA